MIALFAASSQAATITPVQIDASTLDDTFSSAGPDNITAHGGNISFVNITLKAQNYHWMGSVGEVFDSIRLVGANSIFHDWGEISARDGYIIFSPSNSVNWGSLQNGNSMQTQESTSLGLSGVDDVDNTFNTTNSADITIGAITIPAGTSPATLTLNASDDAVWETSLLSDGSNPLYTGFTQDNKASYMGTVADFQIILPVNTTTQSREYYVYAALN